MKTQMMKNETTENRLCILSSVIAAGWTVWYMHYGNPFENSGALSKTGLTHKAEFILWGILTLFALCFNLVSAYRRYTKVKFYIPMLGAAALGMTLTLAFDFDYDEKAQYFLHCAGSLAFSAIMGIAVFLLFLLNYKKAKIFRAFTYISGIILIVDLICLLIFKETAMIEAVPIFAGYIMLGAVNLRREKVEITG